MLQTLRLQFVKHNACMSVATYPSMPLPCNPQVEKITKWWNATPWSLGASLSFSFFCKSILLGIFKCNYLFWVLSYPCISPAWLLYLSKCACILSVNGSEQNSNKASRAKDDAEHHHAFFVWLLLDSSFSINLMTTQTATCKNPLSQWLRLQS